MEKSFVVLKELGKFRFLGEEQLEVVRAQSARHLKIHGGASIHELNSWLLHLSN